jgi:hypothetical protein
MRVANLHRILLLGLATFLSIRAAARSTDGARRTWWSMLGGFVAGILALTKPIFVPVVVCLALRRVLDRAWKEAGAELLGVFAAVAAGAVATALSFGTLDAWRWWAENAGAMVPDEQITIAMGNYAPRRLLGEAFGPVGTAVSLAFAASLCVFDCIAPRPSEGRARAGEVASREDLSVGIGLLAYCWTMRMVWPHYFLLFVPWLGQFVWKGVRRRSVALLALAALSTFGFGRGGPVWSLLALSSLSAALVLALRTETPTPLIVERIEVV